MESVGAGLCSARNVGENNGIYGAEQSPAPTVGDIVCAFKSLTTKLCNSLNDTPGYKLWQRNYYEHIIRTQKSYENISNYIQSNPLKWDSDCMNPSGRGSAPMDLLAK